MTVTQSQRLSLGLLAKLQNGLSHGPDVRMSCGPDVSLTWVMSHGQDVGRLSSEFDFDFFKVKGGKIKH